MASTQHWLAFDIGTTGTKAALLNAELEILAATTHSYDTSRPGENQAEQQIEDWWQALTHTTHTLAGQADLSHIAGIVLSGQMQNLTLLDAAGRPLRPAILYSDTRAQKEAQEVIDTLGASQLRTLTGNEQDASSLWAKLLWLKRHEPTVLERAQRLFLGAADVMAFYLTGQGVCDSTTASATGFLDLHARRYVTKAWFESLGLETFLPLLPEICHGGERIGPLSTDLAGELGLPEQTPVFLAPGDAGATTVGAGSGEIGAAYGYIGTSGWLGFSADTAADPASGVFTLAHPQRERFIQVAPTLTAGGNVQWLSELFGEAEIETITRQAFSRPPSNLLFLPYLNGERCPVRDPLSRGAFVGLSSETRQADIARAVLEGVVYNYRQALNTLSSTAIDTLALIGGGTRSSAWSQLFATITGVLVTVLDDAENAGLKGAVRCAQVASGQQQTYEISPTGTTFTPEPHLKGHYDQRFEQFKTLYPALRETFHQLAKTPTPHGG